MISTCPAVALLLLVPALLLVIPAYLAVASLLVIPAYPALPVTIPADLLLAWHGY